MTLATLLRALFLIAAILMLAGLAVVVYYDFWFDTWTSTVVSASPDLDVPGDFAEVVFYQSDELLSRADQGASTGRRVLFCGTLLATIAFVGLVIERRRHTGRPGG